MAIEERHQSLVHIGRLYELAGTLDARLFALSVASSTRSCHIWNLVTGVPDDHLAIGILDQKVRVEEVLDRLHAPVPVGLFLNHDRLGPEDPWALVQVAHQTREDAVGMHRRHARDVPLVNFAICRINKTHRQILDSTINR